MSISEFLFHAISSLDSMQLLSSGNGSIHEVLESMTNCFGLVTSEDSGVMQASS